MAPEDSDQSTGYQQKAWYYPTFSGGAQTAKSRVCLLPLGTLVDLTRSSDEEDENPGTQTIFVFVTISLAESNRTQSERQLY